MNVLNSILSIKQVILSNFWLFVFNFLIIIISNLSLVYVVSAMYTERTVIDVSANIIEYEEVDIEHLCALTNCKFIQFEKTTYENILFGYDTPDIFLREVKKDFEVLLQFSKHGFITEDFDIKVKLELEGCNFMIIDYTDLIMMLQDYLGIVLTIFILLNFGILITSMQHYNRQLFLQTSKTRSESFSRNMVVLTENIHHELNTPLAVITNKVMKLEKEFNTHNCDECGELNNSCRTKNCKSAMDFKLLNHSISQITDILNTMKRFKCFKGTGNKSLYEIIDTTASVLLVTQPEKFKYTIDADLNFLKIDPKYLSNGELTGIILNMVKNSIDAESTNIKFSIYKDEGFYIADNGNGIADKFINSIYEEDFTTKDGLKENRGNGLYVNKTTLSEAKGSLELIRTDKTGTIFRIKVRTLPHSINRESDENS